MAPMAHNQKTQVFAPTQNARLGELLMLLGCGDEIAPFDADALGKKAGELIAKVSSHQPKPSRRSGVDSSALSYRAHRAGG
jgi:hypothetical protein